MQFTNNWFNRSIPCFETLNSYDGFSMRATALLEIGACEGQSTVWFLDNLLQHTESRMTSIDKEPRGLFNVNLSESPNRDKHQLIVDRSRVALPRLTGSEYDLIYIDGSHFPDDVLRDAILSFELLTVGGIIIFDDYQNETDALLYLTKASRDVYHKMYNTRMNMNRCAIQNKRGSYGSLCTMQSSDAVSFFVHAYAPLLKCVYVGVGVRAFRKLGRSYDEYIMPEYN